MSRLTAQFVFQLAGRSRGSQRTHCGCSPFHRSGPTAPLLATSIRFYASVPSRPASPGPSSLPARRPPSAQSSPTSRTPTSPRLLPKVPKNPARAPPSPSFSPAPSSPSPPLRPRDLAERRHAPKVHAAFKPQNGFNAPTADWPWREMQSRVPGTIAEYRLIFARPWEGRGYNREWMLLVYWAGWSFASGVVIFYIYLIDSTDMGLEAEGDVPWLTSLYVGFLSLLPYLMPLLVAGTLATLISMTKGQNATITRLSQVRVKPADGNGPIKEFIRIRSATHGLRLGLTPPYLDAPLENIVVRSLPDHRLRLTVQRPGRTDRLFSVPLKETPFLDKTTEEVVVSLRRIVLTFGDLRPMSSAEVLHEFESGLGWRMWNKLSNSWKNSQKEKGEGAVKGK